MQKKYMQDVFVLFCIQRAVCGRSVNTFIKTTSFIEETDVIR